MTDTAPMGNAPGTPAKPIRSSTERSSTERRHELRHRTNSNLATCRCGDWSLTDETRKPLNTATVKINYDLHREMVNKK